METVLCNKANSRSPYCPECYHGRPHERAFTCRRIPVVCQSRPWVGKVECLPYPPCDSTEQ